MDFNGFHWISKYSMNYNRFQWISIDFTGYQWISMDFNRIRQNTYFYRHCACATASGLVLHTYTAFSKVLMLKDSKS